MWSLKPERWGSPLVQEKYQAEKACDKRRPYRTTIIIIIIINTIINQKMVYRIFSDMIWRQVPTRHESYPETVVQFTLSKQILLHWRARYILKQQFVISNVQSDTKSRDVFYQQSVVAVKTEYVTAEPLITSHLDGGGKNGSRNVGKALHTDEDDCLKRFTTVTLSLLKISYSKHILLL